MFKPSPQAEEILKKRYYRSGENWEKMCRRVAINLANNPDQRDKFFEVMHSGQFLPNTPCLINAGKPDSQLSACFYLPIQDDMHSIFQTLHDAAQIFKSGGGVGFNFSNLRPEGSIVNSTNGVSSGPISFMKVYDAAIEQIKQGGVRRGAAMGMLSIDHPDVVKFIKCKHIDRKISNFNISVAITDEFMQLVTTQYTKVWETTFGNTKYRIRTDDDTPVEVKQGEFMSGAPFSCYTVGDIWNLICEQAWRNGDPGIIFWDEIIRKNGQEIGGVNPCGEQMLADYEACCLGSIDVNKFVLGADIQWTQLHTVVHTAVDILNCIIDEGKYPLEEITQKVLETRKIGLGIMGWADMLLRLGIQYGSPESLELAEKLMGFITNTAREYSNNKQYKNTTVTTIAPTGTISIIAGCSSGIEPVYQWITTHNREDFETVTVVHPLIDGFFDIDNLPSYFVTALEVTPNEHVAMQAAFQKHVDNAVSKTINLPETATIEDVQGAYYQAWRMKCKGITVYRDGSRQDQVLSREKCEGEYNDDDDDKMVSWEEFTEQMGLPESRPYCLEGYIFKIPLDMANGKIENAYIAIGTPDGHPYEVFVNGNIREADPIAAEYIDTTTRLVSLALRGGIPLDKVVEQLEKVPYKSMFSICHKIAQALKEFLSPDLHPPCPECGAERIYAEGCEKCSSCGWAHCG